MRAGDDNDRVSAIRQHPKGLDETVILDQPIALCMNGVALLIRMGRSLARAEQRSGYVCSTGCRRDCAGGVRSNALASSRPDAEPLGS